jgi:hypothetical protein
MATNGTDVGQITDLITQAEGAHSQYESIILKRPDPRWADWLAGFVLDRSLQKLLPQPVEEAQLARWLTQWDGEYSASQPAADQPATGQPVAGQPADTRAGYFAQRLLDALKVAS